MAGQLEGLGLESLSMIVLTHPQRDHVGGAGQVLREACRSGSCSIRQSPATAPTSARRSRKRTSGESRVQVARAGESFRIGGLTLRVLWPDGPGPPGDDPNNHAIVLLASYGKTTPCSRPTPSPTSPAICTFRRRDPQGRAPRIGRPGLADELKTLRPRVAVISVGAHNDYGHPKPGNGVDARGRSGLALYRTDRDGRVVVESDGAHGLGAQEPLTILRLDDSRVAPPGLPPDGQRPAEAERRPQAAPGSIRPRLGRASLAHASPAP